MQHHGLVRHKHSSVDPFWKKILTPPAALNKTGMMTPERRQKIDKTGRAERGLPSIYRRKRKEMPTATQRVRPCEQTLTLSFSSSNTGLTSAPRHLRPHRSPVTGRQKKKTNKKQGSSCRKAGCSHLPGSAGLAYALSRRAVSSRRAQALSAPVSPSLYSHRLSPRFRLSHRKGPAPQ